MSLLALPHSSWTNAQMLIALAFVLGELESETLLCVRNPLHGARRNLKLAIAKGADSYGGHLTTPFDHPKAAFRHAQPF